MAELNANLSYYFNEEWEFMAESEYRNGVVPFLVNNEDDPRAYFDRVCTEVGLREESVDQLNAWFEDLTGSPPNRQEEADILMLAGKVEPDKESIIRLIGTINEYDLMELGTWDIFITVLDEAENTYYRTATPGEYSSTSLILWTKKSLMNQVGAIGLDPLQALINLREMNR